MDDDEHSKGANAECRACRARFNDINEMFIMFNDMHNFIT